MQIKIYFNDKPLYLCDNINDEIEPYIHHDDAVFIDEFSSPAVNSMIHEMRLEKARKPRERDPAVNQVHYHRTVPDHARPEKTAACTFVNDGNIDRPNRNGDDKPADQSGNECGQ